jgi:hypothetical protein
MGLPLALGFVEWCANVRVDSGGVKWLNFVLRDLMCCATATLAEVQI